MAHHLASLVVGFLVEPPLPRKNKVAQPLAPVEVVEPVVVVRDDLEYPEPTTQEEMYAHLLPQNSLPEFNTLESVVPGGTLPLAVLVLASGEVLPPPLPYIPNTLTQALHTQEEVDSHRKAYDAAEEARVNKRLAANAQPIADPITAPDKPDTKAEDMYGEPLSTAVLAAFPNAKA